MDDVLVTGTHDSEIDAVKQGLDKAFTIKYFGKMRYFLGLEVARNETRILLNQRKYILDIITGLNMEIELHTYICSFA